MKYFILTICLFSGIWTGINAQVKSTAPKAVQSDTLVARKDIIKQIEQRIALLRDKIALTKEAMEISELAGQLQVLNAIAQDSIKIKK